MYSGSDSTESLQNQKWPPINTMFSNASNDHIDWAALAQQWIIMKEAGPPIPELKPPSPPPPPHIHERKKENEGGEAPMEVENEKDEVGQWGSEGASAGSWNWHQQQQWGFSWNPANVPSKPPLLPTPGNFNQYTAADIPGNFQYNNKHAPAEYPPSNNYWQGNGSGKSKPHNKRFSKVNVPQRHAPAPLPNSPALLDQITLDANRRKQLPAWIRDGLEKMERDKLKQIEKEKDKVENAEEEDKPKFNQKEALEIIKSTVKERNRSKFDSDGEDSSNDTRHKFAKRPSPEPVKISHEDLMLHIRRTMTEILLKVTNQEIQAVCKEEFQRRLRKNKASDHRVSATGGTNLSARLGVGIYGDSGSSETGSDSDRESVDSEAELKATIRKRKSEFAKTERQIEQRLASESTVPERSGTPDTHRQSQVDSKHQERVRLGNVSSPKDNAQRRQRVSSNSSGSDSSDVQIVRYEHKSSVQKYSAKERKSSTPERNVTKRRSSNADSHSSRRRSRSSNRSRSRDRYQDYKSSRSHKRSRSRSSTRSYLSTESSSRRSDSYTKNRRRKSRSRSRSRHRKSISSERSHRGRKSRTSRKSRSVSRSRSRSSSSRGKRSRRH